MRNIKCYHKTVLQSVYSNKDYKHSKQNKTVVGIHESLYLLGGETANHVNFMQHMLVSHSSCYFKLSRG